MRTYNLSGLTFELWDSIVYANEQNFIKVSGTANKEFKVYQTFYTTDSTGNALIDYSDAIKLGRWGEFDIIVDDEEAFIEWEVIYGIRPIEPVLPPRKLQICDFADFFIFLYLLQTDYLIQVFYDSEWHTIEVEGGEILVLQNWTKLRVVSESELPEKAYSDVYSPPYTGELSVATYFYCEFERYSCNCSNMKQLTWVGENGKRKSYTFLVAEDKRNVTESLEIEQLNANGYDVRKNFALGYKLQTEKLNAAERAYLSDLVSSSVVLFSDNYRVDAPVTIAATSFVNVRNDEFEALEFDVKFKQYDAI